MKRSIGMSASFVECFPETNDPMIYERQHQGAARNLHSNTIQTNKKRNMTRHYFFFLRLFGSGKPSMSCHTCIGAMSPDLGDLCRPINGGLVRRRQNISRLWRGRSLNGNCIQRQASFSSARRKDVTDRQWPAVGEKSTHLRPSSLAGSSLWMEA